MKSSLIEISANCHELQKSNGARVLFSYGAPVAAFIPGKGFVRTVEKYSVTTTRHVNAWIGGHFCPTVKQSEIEALV